MIDLRALINQGNEIISDYSKYLYVCKQEQAEWFGHIEEPSHPV